MSEKRKFLPFRILIVLLFTAMFAFSQKVNTVVLDAGHGGHDTGALGRHSREKDITLAVVLRLRDYIHANMPDVKVILTREKDEFIELHRRARIANENKADLFISVHCNANPSTAPFGAETYVMGLHKSNANLAVAKAENAAILLEDDYVEQYDGFDPNSPEGTIFFSMMQNSFLDNSLDMAGRLQSQFRTRLNLFDRGVKQAGFLVLYKTAMPGVLIETAFISNAKDEKLLMSEKGQDQIALSIYRALKEYKVALEKENPAVLKEPDSIPFRLVASVSKPPKEESPVQDIIPVTESDTELVIYRVQFASSPTDKETSSTEFAKLEEVWKYYQNGLFKFTAGKFETFREASAYRQEVIKTGYPDAFVVPFLKDQRISIEEARHRGAK